MKSLLYMMGPGAAVLAGMFVIYHLEERRKRSANERPPVKEMLCRAPGHSLQLRMEDLSEKSMFWFLGSVVCACILGSLLSKERLHAGEALGSGVVFSVFTVLGFALGIRPLFTYRNYRLGLKGEQFMAEELGKLAPLGYRVFHDFPGGKNWNIDHVVVGPGGVFAVETKTRKKRKARPVCAAVSIPGRTSGLKTG